jgi:hypothetical protein
MKQGKIFFLLLQEGKKIIFLNTLVCLIQILNIEISLLFYLAFSSQISPWSKKGKERKNRNFFISPSFFLSRDSTYPTTFPSPPLFFGLSIVVLGLSRGSWKSRQS